MIADPVHALPQVSCITPGARLQGLRSDRSIAQPAASESAAFVDLPTAATVHAGETTSLYVHLYEQQSDEAEAPGLSGAAPLPVTTGPLQWFHSRALEAQAKLQQRAKQHKFSAGGLQRQQQGVEAKLAVIWEVRAAGQNPRLGSCLAQQLPSPPRPPLQAVLKGPHRVEHNFKASPLCVVALRLLVANGLIHRTAVSVDCGAPGVSVSPPPIPGTWHTTEGAVGGGMGAQEPPHGQGQPQAGRQSGLTPSAAWQWCGQSHTFLGPLDPGRSSEVGLQVAIMAPGHYQLQGYKLAYSEDDLRSPLDSVPGPPCSITVVQAS